MAGRSPRQALLAEVTALLALSLLAPGAHAKAPEPELEYSAVPGCPAETAFWSSVRKALASAPETSHFKVAFTGSSEGVIGTLEVLRTDGSVLTRRVLTPNCAEAAEALAIVIGQMSQSGFRELAVPEPDAEAATVPDARAGGPSPSPVPESSKPARQPLEPQLPSPEAASDRAQFRAQAGPVWQGTLPKEQRLGVSAGVLVSLPRPWGPEVALSLRWHPPTTRSTEEGGARIWWSGASASFGATVHRLGSSTELRALTALVVGQLRSEGRGVPGARERAALWLAAEARLGLRVSPHPRVFAAASGGAAVPIVRPTITLRNRDVVYDAPRVGSVAEIAGGVRF
jgi:hypothetical protein